jgi:UDP-N-acetylglucosamine diphosphorylase/glucosamine-1-phosphate N-acetyltransferase
MNVILFDDQSWHNLLPLTYTRPVSEIRVGIYTMREKWEMRLGVESSVFTQEYLAAKFPTVMESTNLLVNASVLPDKALVDAVRKLGEKETLVADGLVLAGWAPSWAIRDFVEGRFKTPVEKEFKGTVARIAHPWDIFRLNGMAMDLDFHLLIAGKNSARLSETNTSVGKNIFIEDGAMVEFAHLNSSSGPIYIGKGAEVMEGSLIRGPFALMEGSVVKMGSRIYGPTTVGPYCKVGGEISNTVFFGFSNKAHDGFLGNAVIGEWVNIGADTNASNLKNTYEEIKVWNEPAGKFIQTGLQFCGLIMGDHSRCGINTMFNTATVVGVCSNIFGSGFPRTFIPSFSWGGPQGFTEFRQEKAMEMIQLMMDRRKMLLTESDKAILREVHKITARNRNF